MEHVRTQNSRQNEHDLFYSLSKEFYTNNRIAIKCYKIISYMYMIMTQLNIESTSLTYRNMNN